jgi:hypothetical protein
MWNAGCDQKAKNQAAGLIRRLFVHVGFWLLALSLSGCMLIAGEDQSGDNTLDGGNVYVSFVSAEGVETRSVPTAFPNQPLDVTLFARTESGQLRLELLDPQDSVVVALDAQPSERTNQATVTTNEAGEFRYRIRATGAQNGEFTILYQPSG